MLLSFFFFSCSGDHRDLHSFPTRRSSDLSADGPARGSAPRRRRIATFVVLTGLIAVLWGVTTARADLPLDRKSTRLNSSHVRISYAVFCLKKKKHKTYPSSLPIHFCDMHV